MRFLIVCAILAIVPCVLSAGTAYNFTQMVDHFSTSGATYQQRYYLQDTYFKGPGNPIFCIMGGEGAIPPEVGLYYPFIYAVLAQQFNALVIEPEHRFYGTSMPFGASSLDPANMHLLNPQQALADASSLIVAIQKQYGCGPRGTPTYCPVITVGGSYPGFLSGMMRLRYPQVVDIGYAASAPMRFYSQQVQQGDYYKVITASAERAVAGCPSAVRNALSLVLDTPVQEVVSELNICTPLPPYMSDDQTFYDELMMVIMVQFANMNMGNYPPTNTTALARVCQAFTSQDPWDALRYLFSFLSADSLHASLTSSRLAARLGLSRASHNTILRPNTCFDFGSQTPNGPNGTVSCGDWSGCGGGNDGESWDYETCGFLVEPIGTNNVTDMFPAREWSYDWLTQHCQSRFGISPQPRALADLWGFDHLADMGASHIIFTNGLNDGWSAGGFSANLSDTLLVYNMPNGAHHSDLTHNMPSDSDTPDVKATRASITTVIGYWLSEIRAAAFNNLF